MRSGEMFLGGEKRGEVSGGFKEQLNRLALVVQEVWVREQVRAASCRDRSLFNHNVHK